jgi:hypothetical protein
MNLEFSEDLNFACEAKAPAGPAYIEMVKEIEFLQEYLGMRYNDMPITQEINTQLKNINFLPRQRFEDWYKARTVFYKSEWDNECGKQDC